MVESQALFSEKQVDQLVSAKVELWIAQHSDAAPQTVTIKREKAIEMLKQVDEEVREKYDKTVQAWKKAYKLYATFLRRNPGSKTINDPGPKPLLSRRAERIVGWVRALESLDANDGNVKLSFAVWQELFEVGAEAKEELDRLRNNYTLTTSGSALFSPSLR